MVHVNERHKISIMSNVDRPINLQFYTEILDDSFLLARHGDTLEANFRGVLPNVLNIHF